MWIVTNPTEEDGKPLLLTVQSDKEHFARGLVTYDGTMSFDDVDLDQLLEDYAKQEGLSIDLVRYYYALLYNKKVSVCLDKLENCVTRPSIAVLGLYLVLT